jgi:hypothetical protein
MLFFIIFLLIFISIFALVFYKYYIDTSLTIKELRVDRDSYRSKHWNTIKSMDRERNENKKKMLQESSAAYINLKNKIRVLQSDIEDTDFNNFDNLKEELVAALKQIDSYGDKND